MHSQKKKQTNKLKENYEVTVTMRAVIGQFSESCSTVRPARIGETGRRLGD